MDRETKVSEKEEEAMKETILKTPVPSWEQGDCDVTEEEMHSVSNITPEKMEEFKNVVAPAAKWFRENCNLHQRIIIDSELVVLASDDIGIPLEIPD